MAAAGFSGPAPADTSEKSAGVRADGAHPLNTDWKILYTAEYAKQADYSGGDSRIDATYQRLGVGGQWHDMVPSMDREMLGSNQGRYALLLGKIEYSDYQAGDAASGKVNLTRVWVWVTMIYSY